MAAWRCKLKHQPLTDFLSHLKEHLPEAAPVRIEKLQQVAFQVPVDQTGTIATIQVTRAAGGQTVQSGLFTAIVAPTAPGMNGQNVNGLSLGAFLSSSNAQITFNSPAQQGDTLRITGTGFGAVNPGNRLRRGATVIAAIQRRGRSEGHRGRRKRHGDLGDTAGGEWEQCRSGRLRSGDFPSARDGAGWNTIGGGERRWSQRLSGKPAGGVPRPERDHGGQLGE